MNASSADSSSPTPPRARRAVVACATFKGTLSSRAAGKALARGLQRAGIAAHVVALADGGEGLVDALASQVPGASRLSASCRGPLGEPRTAAYAILPSPAGLSSGTRHPPLAVIEMAASSGLSLVPEAKRDPKITTTLGVGDQILAALNHNNGDVEILLGLGGSATNDGGAGMAQALGARFLDKAGKPLPPGGGALLDLARIDISRLDPRLTRVPVTVACDVRNPLTGPEGATFVFGPQKGGSPEDLKLLDSALAHYAAVIKKDLGKDVANVPGAGAAGGLGAGCLAFLNASLKPGIELVLDALDFDRAIAGAALVITGEGRLDRQTLMGKAPAGVAARARRLGVPCVAIGGGVERGAEQALRGVFARLESLSAFAGSAEAAMREPARWLEDLAKARAEEWLTL
ncbi:MAG: glycerate kinase [Planctomycetota bacterium]|nr:glycerate kinase [Planctomycetota bacterium]